MHSSFKGFYVLPLLSRPFFSVFGYYFGLPFFVTRSTILPPFFYLVPFSLVDNLFCLFSGFSLEMIVDLVIFSLFSSANFLTLVYFLWAAATAVLISFVFFSAGFE